MQKLYKSYKPRNEGQDVPHAIQELRECTQKHYEELVDILADPEYDQTNEHDQRDDWVPLKQLIWEALLQSSSQHVIQDIEFLLSHPDPYICRKFALHIAKIGELSTLNIIQKALNDDTKDVREYASYGLRDRTEHSFSQEFAERAASLLEDYIQRYPQDEDYPRREALKVFSPQAFARLYPNHVENSQLLKIYEKVHEIAGDSSSYKEDLLKFQKEPAGYKYVFCLLYVDADIRNGGIYQLHANSTWHLIFEAIQGARAFDCHNLAMALDGILFYYFRRGRSRMKRQIPKGYFEHMPANWNKSLDDLEDQYYESFEQVHCDSFKELLNTILQTHSDMFQE